MLDLQNHDLLLCVLTSSKSLTLDMPISLILAQCICLVFDYRTT